MSPGCGREPGRALAETCPPRWGGPQSWGLGMVCSHQPLPVALGWAVEALSSAVSTREPWRPRDGGSTDCQTPRFGGWRGGRRLLRGHMSWWRPGARVHWPRSPGALEMSPGPGILQLLGTSEPQGSRLERRCLGSEVPGSWTRLGTLGR